MLIIASLILAIAIVYHAWSNERSILDQEERHAANQRVLQKEHHDHEVKFAQWQREVFMQSQKEAILAQQQKEPVTKN